MVISSINEVLERPFCSFTKEEQLKIIDRGRFTDLRNISQNDRGRYRGFVVDWYNRVKWLTGNTMNKKLYCWSCVLFPSGTSKTWNLTGFGDLKNLSKAIRKHEESKGHTYSTIKLKLFSKHKRSEKKKEEAVKSNVLVKRNREYMERLIDVASALTHFEVPFSTEVDGGLYRYFMNMFKKYDDIVRTQIEENSPFTGLTTTIQTDLLQSMGHIILQQTVADVSVANFFALMVDVVNCSRISRQISVSIRFVKEAKPVERLVGFYDISNSGKAEEIVALLERELERFNFKEKMIAQSYDGGVVRSMELYNLQQSMKRLQNSPIECQFVHCYSHEFYAVLIQSLRRIQECKLFFSIINMFCAFFKRPYLKHVFLNIDPACMETVFSCITVIKEQYTSVLLILENVNTANEFDNCSELLAIVISLINHLKNEKFMVMVTMFHNLLSATKTSFDNLTSSCNAVASCAVTDSLISQLNQIKHDIMLNNLFVSLPNTSGQTVMKNMYDLYVQIIDHIVYEIEARFLDVELLEFCSLVSLQNILPRSDGSGKTPPDNSLISIIKDKYSQYSQFFDIPRLQTDLYLLYTDPSIAGIGETETDSASKMLRFMHDHDITSCLPMLSRLLELVITIPSVAQPLSGKECVLNRIRDYCSQEKNEEPRNAFALFTIENEIFYEIEKTNHWYNDVIDYFASLPSTSSIELMYTNTDPIPVKVETITEPELSIKSDLDI